LTASEKKLLEQITQKDGELNVVRVRERELEKTIAAIQQQLEQLESHPIQRLLRKFQGKK
jgi:hypothetical protein